MIKAQIAIMSNSLNVANNTFVNSNLLNTFSDSTAFCNFQSLKLDFKNVFVNNLCA